jgi:uroporphyrinogen-III synthase
MPRAIPALSLAQWYVISLRPLGLHAGVRRAAAKFGARTFALSTLAIEPLAAAAALKKALSCPIVIVTSPNAARHASTQHPLTCRRGQHWYAVGPGTAAALRRHGIRDVIIPEQGVDSDALLALPALAKMTGLEVGLITAPGGRGQLAKVLAERGAKVRIAEVYRRVSLTPPPHRLRALATLPERTALLVSSGEALANLWRSLSKSQRAGLIARPCVASSRRLDAQLHVLGFRQRALAADARPDSLLAALAEHPAKRRFR